MSDSSPQESPPDDFPHEFSNVAHKAVHDEKRDSVFFVKVVRRQPYHDQILQHLTANLHMTRAKAKETIAEPFYSTGFMVNQDGDMGYILTCCHLLQDFYSNENMLTLEQARMFKFLILCKHNESHMVSTDVNLYDRNPDPRNYAIAIPIKVDQKRDLLLLQVDMANLHVGIYPNRCEVPHPPLQLVHNLPRQLDDVVMISWPPHNCDTVVIGQVVNYRRYHQITSNRDKGYDMNVIELKINGPDGTSGSPVLDHNGDVTSLYHGRILGKGYAVSAEEIYGFLND